MSDSANLTGSLGDAQRMMAEAMNLLAGDRQEDYGDPRVNHERIAELWGAYLGLQVQPHDVAMLMVLMKASRLARSPGHVDSWKDMIAYASLGAAFAEADAW